MTLLEQASLIMIPSGYKEDVVYSVIPETGAGDLSFTRSSNGTRINSAGLVEVVPWNLAQQSESFDNAFWSVDNGSITANSTTAPNGTATADTLTRNASTAYLYNGSFNLGIGEFTQSIYAKANASSSIRLEFVTGAFARGAACIFDLSNGTAGTITIYGGVSGFTASIESVGNGWYRCSIGGTITIADTYYYEISITTGSIYIWGAQLNIGATAKPYFPTTDRLNVPRLTYQNGGGGCPSLLLEKQSTNYARNNNDLNGWTKITGTDTISLNAGTSPDGTANGINLIPSTANGTHMFYDGSTSVSSSGNFTMTCYVKANGYSKFAMRESASVGYYASFNLSNGTVLDNGGNTASIENLGNGWYRCICSVVASTTVQIGLLVLSDSYTSGQPFGLTWSGDGTKGILVYGPQLEVSASYATSLISTAGVASATRVADVCTKTGIGALIGGTSGTVFFDIKTNPVLTTDNYKQFFYYTDSSTNQGYMYLNSGNGIITNPPFGNLSSSITLSPNTRYKIALTYASNDCALYVNGVSVATASSATPLNFENLLSLGSYQGASEFNQFVFNQYTHFPSRLTNSELVSLTTI